MLQISIGRIVHYNSNGNRRAAIVTVVHSNTVVDVEVFGETDPDARIKTMISFAEEAPDEVASARPNSMVNRPGHWAWPPRV